MRVRGTSERAQDGACCPRETVLWANSSLAALSPVEVEAPSWLHRESRWFRVRYRWLASWPPSTLRRRVNLAGRPL